MPTILKSIAIASLLVLVASPTLGADPPPRPTPHPPAALEGSPVPWCGDVQPVYAAPELYLDEPVYVANEMPKGKINRWAKSKPGFVLLWIDRDHNGWVNVQFSEDAEARQAELEREFPGVGVVAVGVEYSKQELKRTARRLGEFLEGRASSFGYGWGDNRNIVSLSLNAVTDELVSELEAEFAGEPLCISGGDPEDIVAPGPQPLSGDGWALLGFEQGRGPAHELGLATDEQQYQRLWGAAGLADERPAVDFADDIVVWFAIGHGSSCSDLRLQEVIVDHERAAVYPLVVVPGSPMACTSDLAGAYQFVVALSRSDLPAGPFEIGLDEGLFRSQFVDTDLSLADAVASDSEGGEADPEVARSGTVVETIGKSKYTFDTSCGIRYLGVINDTHWVTDEGPPDEWMDSADDDGELVVTIRLRTDPEPRVSVSRNGFTVRYEPAPEPPALCDA